MPQLQRPQPAQVEKEHLLVLACGHGDSGESTSTRRLIFELSGLPDHMQETLRQESVRLGKSSSALAFYTDRQKEERERAVTHAGAVTKFGTYSITPINALPAQRRARGREMLNNIRQMLA